MGSFKELGKMYGHPIADKLDEKTEAISSSDVSVDNISSSGSETNIDDLSAIVKDALGIYNKDFLHELDSLPVRCIGDIVDNSISWIKIDKIVYEKDVFFTDCLSIIFSSLSNTTDLLSFFIQKNKGANVSFYIGVKDKIGISDNISKYILQRSILGNLPGLSFTEESPSFTVDDSLFVSSVSGVASLRNEKNKKFVQGFERLVNSTDDIPSYKILLLAKNISSSQRADSLNKFRSDYNKLFKLSEVTEGENFSSGSSATKTSTSGINKSVVSNKSNTSNSSKTENSSETKTEGSSDGAGFVVNAGSSVSNAKTSGTSNTSGISTTTGSSTTEGSSSSESFAEGTTSSSGSSKQFKIEDKVVKDLLKKIELLVERFEASERLGLWDFAAYFLADTKTTSIGLASIYSGIISGSSNGSLPILINSWAKDNSSKIQEYLCRYEHPQFDYGDKIVSPAIPTTSEELSVNMSLPQSSIPGVLVRKQASFGRNVIVNDEYEGHNIDLGAVTHLGKVNPKNRVILNENILTSHVFITGSTGSGKSNTIYYLLDQLLKEGKKILVVEPVKGEYKNIFGGHENIHVLGTNPEYFDLLKINPFSFPNGVHVTEHIDRLVDIFNACWPMYAAMPAVLKESISRAYVACGWDMVTSTSKSKYYPTISDVISELNNYINSSEYSSDSKGDYKGALGTRLQSLSNGIIGQVLSGDELDGEMLFNSNVIVDLSRVGSNETKSLIMGFLVLKLNEFRMSENIGMNLPLRHVTVLEEAHNLLKQTSTMQSQESSNLTGKSVEMISSAIAEMRTFGEGFIIADQTPSMLDKSAIANTNTKIVMCLPYKVDRELASYSIGLNEEQMEEISKFKTGIGVIHQKGWEEPVLCSIEHFVPSLSTPYTHEIKPFFGMYDNSFIDLLYNGYCSEVEISYDDWCSSIALLNMPNSVKYKIEQMSEEQSTLSKDTIARAFVLIHGEEPFEKASKLSNIRDFNSSVRNTMLSSKFTIVREHADVFVNMYIKGCSLMNATSFYETWLAQTLMLK